MVKSDAKVTAYGLGNDGGGMVRAEVNRASSGSLGASATHCRPRHAAAGHAGGRVALSRNLPGIEYQDGNLQGPDLSLAKAAGHYHHPLPDRHSD